MKKLKDRYGNLVLIEKIGKGKNAGWLCQCDCGNQKFIKTVNLRHAKCGTKSCGCSRHREDFGDWQKIEPFRSRFNKLLRVAKDKNRIVEITFEDYLEFTHINLCHYCFKKVDWSPHLTHGNLHGYNIDRKDSEISYVKNNLVVCCARCNWGKSNIYTYEEWWRMTECFRKDYYESTRTIEQLDGTGAGSQAKEVAGAVDQGREAEGS